MWVHIIPTQTRSVFLIILRGQSGTHFWRKCRSNKVNEIRSRSTSGVSRETEGGREGGCFEFWPTGAALIEKFSEEAHHKGGAKGESKNGKPVQVLAPQEEQILCKRPPQQQFQVSCSYPFSLCIALCVCVVRHLITLCLWIRFCGNHTTRSDGRWIACPIDPSQYSFRPPFLFLIIFLPAYYYPFSFLIKDLCSFSPFIIISSFEPEFSS